jgi:CBS domain-containing protein
MQPAAEILSTERTVAEALEKVQDSSLQAWPVNDETGVIGVVSREALRKVADSGGGARRLLELLDAHHFPHVHADHSLTAALDRMGAAQLDLLPVVSRANLRKLEGVITLQAVLTLYGVSVKPQA